MGPSARTTGSKFLRPLAGVLTTGLIAACVAVVTASAPARADSPATIVPVVPARLLDTRGGDHGTIDGFAQQLDQPVTSHSTTELLVAGRGGVPEDATAVLLNVAAVDPAGPGYLTAYPCDVPRPLASNVNHGRSTRSNMVLVELSAAGTACLYASSDTDLLADVAGYVPPQSSLGVVVPARLLDTRENRATVDGESQGTGFATPMTPVAFRAAGRGGVPSGATAVALTVTATGSLFPGHLVVHPCDQPRPATSNVNYRPFATQSNFVLSQVAPDGSVCIQSSGVSHIVVDVSGYVLPNAVSEIGSPARLLDTRSGYPTVDGAMSGAGAIAGGSTIQLQVAGRGGSPSDATAALINVGAVEPSDAGYLTVYPCDAARPVASSVNFTEGNTQSNAVLAALDGSGSVCIFASASTNLIADVTAGWTAADAPPVAPPPPPVTPAPPATTSTSVAATSTDPDALPPTPTTSTIPPATQPPTTTATLPAPPTVTTTIPLTVATTIPATTTPAPPTVTTMNPTTTTVRPTITTIPATTTTIRPTTTTTIPATTTPPTTTTPVSGGGWGLLIRVCW